MTATPGPQSKLDPAAAPLPVDRALTLLRDGEMELLGRLVDASNATLYAGITHDGLAAHCVYKPVRGERPLWDFPDGTLAGREVAAYLVSETTGWDVVPPTVLRDGPFGPGMCQLWIDTDETVDLADLARSDHPCLRRMAVFDAAVNNADRKGGHLLPTATGHVYGVDHGVCFATQDKLRTLLWRWRGTRFNAGEIDVLRRLQTALDAEVGAVLGSLLTPGEVAAARRRVRGLLGSGRFPQPSNEWPAIPWPPF